LSACALFRTRSRNPAITDENRQIGGTPPAVARDGKLLGVIISRTSQGGIRGVFPLRRSCVRILPVHLSFVVYSPYPSSSAISSPHFDSPSHSCGRSLAAEAGRHTSRAGDPEEKLQLIPNEQPKEDLVGDVRRRHQRRAGARSQRRRPLNYQERNRRREQATWLTSISVQPDTLIEVVSIGTGPLMTRAR